MIINPKKQTRIHWFCLTLLVIFYNCKASTSNQFGIGVYVINVVEVTSSK